jgi:hypothetical protein
MDQDGIDGARRRVAVAPIPMTPGAPFDAAWTLVSFRKRSVGQRATRPTPSETARPSASLPGGCW